MGYEVFSRQATRLGKPGITVSNRGRVGINQPAVRIMGLAQGSLILLLWDDGKGSFAIQKIESDDNRSYRVGLSKGSAGFQAKTFLDYIGYDYRQTRSLAAQWNEKDNLLEIQIPLDCFTHEIRVKRSLRKLAAGGSNLTGKRSKAKPRV